MLRLLLICCLSILGTNIHAQSIEERLSECIAQSQRIVTYANAWKASLDVIGERARPSEFAEIVTSYAYQDLLSGAIDSLNSNNDPQKLANELEQASSPIRLQTELIEAMVDEAFTKENRFEEMAEYVSSCTSNFGGETYKLQDVIEELELSLTRVSKDKDVLEEKLEKQISDLEKRLEKATVLLQISKVKLLEYEQTIIDLKGFDTVAYLDDLVKMGVLDRNKEIYEGKFSKAKLESSEELKCFSALRDRGQLRGSCKTVLTKILNNTLYDN